MSNSEEPIDVVINQRLQLAQRRNEDVDPSSLFPPKLIRRYSVYLKPLSGAKALSVRQAKGANIGHLICVRGIVTRISDVKPSMVVATYTCSSCGSEIFQEVRQLN